MSTHEFEIAQKQQEKFEFYLISLVFTLLALSIQTSDFGNSNIADSFELLGWFLLLVSGLTGLWRMEFLPVERVKAAQQDHYRDKIIEMEGLLQQGVNEVHVLENNAPQPVTERRDQYQAAVDTLSPVIKNLEKSNLFKYTVHRYAFVAGVTSLILSRAFMPASNLLSSIC